MNNQLYRPAGVCHQVTSQGDPTESDAVGDQTYAIMVTGSKDFFVTFANEPTATRTNGAFVMANWPTMFKINPGEKVGIKEKNQTGVVFISELTR